ncbi:LPS assembly protein LptD [Psychromonas sp. RZ22]|uniref:LPS assembly protein LptD n=1 Tax=Psychromonas algarum TaxID=2555643 RepID=UPI0010677E9E|nr:LPS assembly protein LptD [Psychromonas sp. RZ22]TEW54404.1 LPS assembly protein LptD [Psychromonas sp. RZ22]
MLKLFPVFLILFPIASITAQADENNDSNTNVNTGNGSDNTTVAADIAPVTLEQKSEPRDVRLFFKQCYRNVPPIVESHNKKDKNHIPIDIGAFSLKGIDNKIVYQGDVNLTQGDKSLTSDSLTYDRNTEEAYASGNAKFVNGQMTLFADQVETNLKTNESYLYHTEYQFHGQGGRGDADRIYDNGQDVYELNSSSYTACPPEDTTWRIDSSTLYIDNVEEMGTAYNAVLRIKDVPVFYFPYISYPLTDKRKTGLLFPSYKLSSVNGTTVDQPLYINIAPNQDATITPTYMENRGTLLATDYRYLFDAGTGNIHGEYLSDDRIRDDSRYLFHFNHNVNFAQDWNFNADYSRVSDQYYFSDIDTDYGTRSDNQLLQTAKLSYSQVNWNSEVEVRDFQILGTTNLPYSVLPKVAFSAYQPLGWKSLQFDWYSEVTKFGNADKDVYTGTRVHLEPKLSLPLYYNSMFVDTELKYMVSYYQQDLGNTSNNTNIDNLDETATRYLPSFKIHSGINLERDFSLFDNDYRQTLVPQVQYLYVPYTDQTDIGLYDTTSLQQDYYGLFRDNRYSGYDRIADANQITVGLSSSFLNPQGKEKLRFAVGQNYYLSQSKTTLDMTSSTSSSTDTQEVSRSSVIGEFDVNFEDDYFFHAGMEWSSDNNIIQRANSTIEKRWAYNTFMQVNYRYYREDEDAKWYEVVNQVGSKINWSINTQWTTFASYYYDIKYENTFERIVGVKYQSCCWAVGLTYDEHMLPYYGSESNFSNTIETERSIGLTIELMGLGGVGYTTEDEGLFDYGRPFYLK